MRALAFLLALAVSVASSAAEIDPPSGEAAAHPFLTTTPDGRLAMSWTEKSGDRHAVKMAVRENGRWSAPRTIVERDDLFVNWADFPSILVTKGAAYVHWLQKSGSGKYAYDVHVSRSKDGGKSWTPSRVIHSDGTESEHGFVSLVPMGNAAGILWLDGRQMAGGHEGHGDMTLRFARLGADGKISNEALLDERVCECCTTGMAMTAAGPVAVYRDRSAGEIRDIGVVRLAGGRWTKPVLLHADGWKIAGCPVNGPQIDARGQRVAVAWFAAPENKGRVSVAFSSNAGADFTAPIPVDAGSPTGRVDVRLLGDGSAVVTWLEGSGDEAYVAARRVKVDGSLAPIVKIAASSGARGSGFPRIAVAGDALFVAWTDPQARRIRLHSVPLP